MRRQFWHIGSKEGGTDHTTFLRARNEAGWQALIPAGHGSAADRSRRAPGQLRQGEVHSTLLGPSARLQLQVQPRGEHGCGLCRDRDRAQRCVPLKNVGQTRMSNALPLDRIGGSPDCLCNVSHLTWHWSRPGTTYAVPGGLPLSFDAVPQVLAPCTLRCSSPSPVAYCWQSSMCSRNKYPANAAIIVKINDDFEQSCGALFAVWTFTYTFSSSNRYHR